MITYKTLDGEGNEIIIENRSIVSIRLRSEKKRKRIIGVIKDGTFTIIKKRVVHLWRGCYGFNHYVLSRGETFDTVKVLDDFGEYVIPKKVLLTMGDEKVQRMNTRFEKQIYINLNQLKKYETNKKI